MQKLPTTSLCPKPFCFQSADISQVRARPHAQQNNIASWRHEKESPQPASFYDQVPLPISWPVQLWSVRSSVLAADCYALQTPLSSSPPLRRCNPRPCLLSLLHLHMALFFRPEALLPLGEDGRARVRPVGSPGVSEGGGPHPKDGNWRLRDAHPLAESLTSSVWAFHGGMMALPAGKYDDRTDPQAYHDCHHLQPFCWMTCNHPPRPSVA